MANKIYTFRTIIKPDEPSGYHGYVPSLPGCHTDGKTIEETQKNLKEAIAGILEVALKYGDPIPQEEATVEYIQSFSIEPKNNILRAQPVS